MHITPLQRRFYGSLADSTINGNLAEDEVYEDKPGVMWKRVYWTFRGRLDFQPMRINLMRQHLHHALEPLLSILADDRHEVSVIRHREAPYVVSVDMNAYELGKIPSLGPHFASLLR
ncbi:hypothetical protein [Endozoicomonas sp. SCSIO W0465]|uniref:hypothetical protein n=1 Tax=Endozoicomonas sp. SCSIO W0465 TaxID=2918516 RepID=UPI00207638ED|nr:hypothetical protein [Endozoicomonas sp. SCSIO W0465]USE38875.1 hypothetical protein MJO57_12315 [Endozoicomonas sp. SCSIO W0465]